MRKSGLVLLCVLAATFALTLAHAADLRIGPPVPATQRPGDPGRDYPFFATDRDLAAEGYVEQEVFVEGEAAPYSTLYSARVETGAVTGPAAPFKTRLLIRRPARAADFNGTVVVEWLNVSNGFEADNVWLVMQDHLVRRGYAWVGVAAQGFGGVEPLRAWSPRRYGQLHIDNSGRMAAEPYALDLFRQVGAALKSDRGSRLLGGLTPRLLIATGQSQSAVWLSSLINGGWARDAAFDGYLLVSATGAHPDPGAPRPVMRIVAESDAEASDNGPQAADSAMLRRWEVAGTSHVDRHLRAAREPLQLRDLGVSTQAQLSPTCRNPAIGTTTAMPQLLAAALEGLVRWTRGRAPPRAPALVRAAAPAKGLVRDDFGMAKGGIRLPEVTAPLGVNLGVNAGAPACAFQGAFAPFDAATLERLYPRPGDYVRAVRASVRHNLRAGYLLPADGARLIAQARETASSPAR